MIVSSWFVLISLFSYDLYDPAIEIGFEQTQYNVSEGDEVEVCAVLTQGMLETDATVSVTSSDVTANGK